MKKTTVLLYNSIVQVFDTAAKQEYLSDATLEVANKQKIINQNVINNYSKLKPLALLLPLSLLLTIFVYLYSHDALHVTGYIAIQKDLFFYLNSGLSQFPRIMYSLTQFGDALIFLSFLTLFIMYAPKMWECLISALLVSVLFTCLPKKIFAVPRPAAALDTNHFTIIGKTLSGHNSLPSGHSITIFTLLTVVAFAFAPAKRNHKVLYFFLVAIVGLLLVSTRVGVGAHYPLDVIIGSLFGCISGIMGILISKKYKIWNWVNHKKYYPVFILLFLICCTFLIRKIAAENLILYYLAFASIVISTYKMLSVYVKK